jgi:single-strand DNA-binding protein
MLNRITIHGRMTRDPELRYTQSNTPVASFTVAVDRDYTDQSGSRETDFIDCVAWRAGAEFVSKYFRKGQLILVDGRLTSRKWTDKDGNKRTSWEIIADHTYFGESKRSDDSGQSYSRDPSSCQAPQPAQQQSNQQTTFRDLPDDDGELPF